MKTYTEEEVKNLLKKQKEMCSIVPKLAKKSLYSGDGCKEHNQMMDDISKAIITLPEILLAEELEPIKIKDEINELLKMGDTEIDAIARMYCSYGTETRNDFNFLRIGFIRAIKYLQELKKT